MIVECPFCMANVDGRVLYEREDVPGKDDDYDPYKTSLIECLSCKSLILVGQNYVIEDDSDWGKGTRLWPSPRRYLAWSIPSKVRTSLEEAEKCLGAGAWIGCVAMCGRALEGVCRHFKTKSQYLGGGLKELKQREIIDKRLYEWSQELQRHRNIAAHATDENISKQDAEELLDFVVSISDYIFVLNEKFEQFMKRKQDQKIAPHNKS